MWLVISDFLVAYSHECEGDTFRRLITPTLNSARSINIVVRENAVLLFQALIQKTSLLSDAEFTVGELLGLPKAGKTAGPDHRVALYTMLGALTPATPTAFVIMQTALPLLSKETHDAAIFVLASSLTSHLAACLRENYDLPGDITILISREMTNSKPTIRRAFCSLVGDALWSLGKAESKASQAFVRALLPAFETNLKTVAANPLNSAAGPLEGYTALAVILGPLFRSEKFGRSVVFCPSPCTTSFLMDLCCTIF